MRPNRSRKIGKRIYAQSLTLGTKLVSAAAVRPPLSLPKSFNSPDYGAHFRRRKNSLFYKTCIGTEVVDLNMSFIHTCELNSANLFDYLTELQKHATELAKNPAASMP